jgi:hypothetical protein
MKQIAFFLLPAGLLIAISSPVMLPSGPLKYVFVFAGLAVELLGLVLLVRDSAAISGGEK